MSLFHRSPDCTRRWDVRHIGSVMFWHCDRCGAMRYDTAQNHIDAIQENLAGNQLDQLTKEERELLDR